MTTPSPTVTEFPSGTPVSSATIGPDILNPQGNGVTIGPNDPSGFILLGGTYRIAWWTTGCTSLQIWLAVGDWTDSGKGVQADLPGGQRIDTNVPAGQGYVDHVAECPIDDLTVRFEKLP